MSPPRLLVIGLDAVDAGLVRSWAAAGALPTWQALLAEGPSFPIVNPPGLYVGAVWPSLFTGVSPSRHGRYCYEQLRAGTYEVQQFRTTDYRVAPFWTALARAGRAVALADVPKSPPPDPGVALHVVDWGTHDPDPEGFRTQPAGLKAEIERGHGVDPVDLCDGYGSDVGAARELLDRLVRRIETRTRLYLDLLSRQAWDLFFAVFSEGHCAGHQFWHVRDPAHPRHDPALREALGDPVARIYRALDGALARLMDAVGGPRTPTLVLASHGMGPHNDATFMLPDLLLAMQGAAMGTRGVRGLERGWRLLPETLRASMRPTVAHLRRRLSRQRAIGERPLGEVLRMPPIARLRYFAVPNNDAHGAIRLNLAGREPRGLVQPGSEATRVVDEIRDGLMSFVNEESGEPIAEAVQPIGELFPGEPTDELPDLIVHWNRRTPIRRVRSARYGSIAREFPGVRTGDHRPEGLLVARGPGIVAGPGDDPVRSVDVPATIACMLGVPLPDLDGRPIAALLGTPRPASPTGRAP
jgi:predicted AlkP superfamily phosphohydrolase/phosphomutase